MTDDGDTPGPTQDFLSLHPAHVVHIGVVFGKAKDPKRVNHTYKLKVRRSKSSRDLI